MQNHKEKKPKIFIFCPFIFQSFYWALDGAKDASMALVFSLSMAYRCNTTTVQFISIVSCRCYERFLSKFRSEFIKVCRCRWPSLKQPFALSCLSVVFSHNKRDLYFWKLSIDGMNIKLGLFKFQEPKNWISKHF